MWYDEHGEGEPLVMLRPGGADSRAFGPNLEGLASRFHYSCQSDVATVIHRTRPVLTATS